MLYFLVLCTFLFVHFDVPNQMMRWWTSMTYQLPTISLLAISLQFYLLLCSIMNFRITDGRNKRVLGNTEWYGMNVLWVLSLFFYIIRKKILDRIVLYPVRFISKSNVNLHKTIIDSINYRWYVGKYHFIWCYIYLLFGENL